VGSQIVAKIFSRSCGSALLLLFLSTLAFGALPDLARDKATSKPSLVGNFDARVNGRTALATAAASRPAANATLHAQFAPSLAAAMASRGKAAADFRVRVPTATIEFSPGTLAPENVYSSAGPLTAPSTAPSSDIAKSFLRSESALYGLSDADIESLELIGESVSPSGLRMLRVRQVVNGRRVFMSETRILLDPQGSVLRTLGALVPGAEASAEPDGNLISASTALIAAMTSVGVSLQTAQIHEPAAAGAPVGVGIIRVDDARISGDVGSELVYFPLLPGTLIPAWQQVTFTSGSGAFTTIVDAATGTLLWRKNIQSHASTQDARFSVYVQADGATPTSPAPHAPTTQAPGAGTQYPAISRTTVSMFSAQNLTASPNGWITDGGSTTTGNNVDAYLDLNADDTAGAADGLDNNGRPIGNPDAATHLRDFLGSTPRDFGYTPAPLVSNPDAGDPPTNVPYRRGVVTNLFYLANWYHDKLYALGFDEAAGNFQTNNFGHGGTGGDPVLAEAQDGGGTNNANFATPPDGMSGRMQMYIFPGPTPDRDGDLDPDIVLHEMTHGTSNRLMGNGTGLLWDVGGGMGEGWSDFYALSLQHNTNADDPNGEYGAGAWTVYKLGPPPLTDNYLYGIRAFPYSTVNTINPQTWADVDDITVSTAGGIAPSPLDFGSNGAGEVHNIGVIWANTLWEVRSRVIAANGNSVPTGNGKMLQIVTDAMKLTPANPSYVQARDALIAADCAGNACANEDSIWGGFADRGLGYNAIAPLAQSGIEGFAAYTGVKESFVVPHLDVQTVAVNDSLGNNNGKIEAGEPIRLIPTMFNPWHVASKNITSATVVLTSSTPGVTVLRNASSVGAVAAQGTLAGSPFLISVGAATLCGQSLDFTATITSQPGNVVSTAAFKIRVGNASGTDAPITYTSTIMGGLAIPDNDLLGVTNVLSIADDKEISSIQFRVDNLTHTFVGDLGLGLKGPTGYGATMIFHPGSYINGSGNSGNDFINTVIDDTSSNDLDLALPAAAPFTGTWATAFNSPVFNTFNPVTDPGFFPDPVGQLSRFNGGTTKGNWTVFVADWAASDTGTLNAWSVIVTPKHFVCAAFTPAPLVLGTKSVTGSFTPGGAIAYTVVLTNAGAASQGDNPGNEFSDVLPSSLALVSATANSGTAVANVGTNTVTWNGSIAAASSVTITINATVKVTTPGGTVVSNQGTISYDSDNNGTNDATGVTDDPSTLGANDATSFTVAAGGNAPVLQSVVLRRVHGVAGTFDITLSPVLTAPTTEPRTGPSHQMVFTYDKPLNAATATVTEGTATPSSSVVGSTVVVNLTGVPNAHYVTVTLSGVGSTDGGTGGTGVARAGFLVGDVNQNRVVTVADLGLVNAQLAQLVTASNFLKDVNASGTLTVADKGLTNAQLTAALPAP
jgi:uncharacterized repeat protein (TIGR01451 family)